MSNQETLRVLIAQDDPPFCETIRNSLEAAGYSVVGEAADGLDVVEMTQSMRPDVVMMDISMPNMDGIEATQRIFECCPTPVIVLNAHGTPDIVERASKAGAGAFLVKPTPAREIERAITIAMARFGDMMAPSTCCSRTW